ncbi:MAG TPA: hypothetical protein PKD55_13005 [Bellilinea sp.]|nr:hypothetical protein [Bellilinea sp.]
MRAPLVYDATGAELDEDWLDSAEKVRDACEKTADLLRIIVLYERQLNAAMRVAGPLTAEQEDLLSAWTDTTNAMEHGGAGNRSGTQSAACLKRLCIKNGNSGSRCQKSENA